MPRSPSQLPLVIAGAVTAAALLQARPARALEFTWDAPSDCPSRDEVASRLARLGPDEAAGTRAAIAIRRSERGFDADIETQSGGRSGQRRLSAGSCGELTDAVVVVLSLLAQGGLHGLDGAAAAPPPGSPGPATPSGGTAPVGPAGTASSSAPPIPPTPAEDPLEPEDEPEEPEGAEEPPDSEPERAPEADAREEAAPSAPLPRELRARAGVGVTGFASGGAELGAGLGFQLALGRIAFDAQAGYRRPLQNVTAGEVEFELQSIDASALVCAVFDFELRLLACAGPSLEVLLATAPEVSEPHFDSVGIFRVVGGVRAALPLGGRWHLALSADGHLRTRSVHLDVIPYGRVLDLPLAGVSLLAGPEIAF